MRVARYPKCETICQVVAFVPPASLPALTSDTFATSQNLRRRKPVAVVVRIAPSWIFISGLLRRRKSRRDANDTGGVEAGCVAGHRIARP
jgi:hypothetical protein